MKMTFSPAILAYVKSETREGVVHQIRIGADGNVYCTCEAWKYQKLSVTNRTCKHLQAFALQANLPNGLPLMYRQMLSTMIAQTSPKPTVRPRKAPARVVRQNPWTTTLPS